MGDMNAEQEPSNEAVLAYLVERPLHPELLDLLIEEGPSMAELRESLRAEPSATLRDLSFMLVAVTRGRVDMVRFHRGGTGFGAAKEDGNPVMLEWFLTARGERAMRAHISRTGAEGP